MILNPFPGRKVDFEGLNGSGKSEQVKLVRPYILASHPGTVFTKEPWTVRPDGSPVASGLVIYDILNRRHPVHTEASLGLEGLQTGFLYPNRLEHYREVVIPALSRGRHVVSDRGPASVCFGAPNPFALGGLMATQSAFFAATEIPFIWADAILIYDVPADVAMERLSRAGKPLDDQENIATQERVRRNYHRLASVFPNCHLIDGSGTPDEVFIRTRGVLDRVLSGRP